MKAVSRTAAEILVQTHIDNGAFLWLVYDSEPTHGGTARLACSSTLESTPYWVTDWFDFNGDNLLGLSHTREKHPHTYLLTEASKEELKILFTNVQLAFTLDTRPQIG